MCFKVNNFFLLVPLLKNIAVCQLTKYINLKIKTKTEILNTKLNIKLR